MNFEIEFLVKIGLSIFLGGLVGFEREVKGRPAGFRTLSLVCLSSSVLMILSLQSLVGLDGPANVTFNIDPARMGAGIVTGVGFLGAGAILKREKDEIKGITTAACIWFVAAIGIAIGIGEYLLSAITVITALTILRLFSFVEKKLEQKKERNIEN